MSRAKDCLTEEQICEFSKAFEMFDEDGGGDISLKELGKAMTVLGWNPTGCELQEIINTFDSKGEIVITLIGRNSTTT